jgi:hypothetical protein
MISKYQLILKGIPELELDLSDLLRTGVKVSPHFAKVWENELEPDAVIEDDIISIKMSCGPKIRLTVTEDDFTEFSAYTITERTQRLDKKQVEVLESILASNYITDVEETIKFPVYFYDSGSMMEWVFTPSKLAYLALWYGLKGKV